MPMIIFGMKLHDLLTWPFTLCGYMYLIVFFVFVFSFPEFGGFGSVSGKIEIEIKINHEGEVNR